MSTRTYSCGTPGWWGVLALAVLALGGCKRTEDKKLKLPPPSTQAGQVVINEVLYDPAGTATAPAKYDNQDLNGNGAVESNDEFVELVNTTTTTVNLDGWVLKKPAVVLYTFQTGDTLAPGKALVVVSVAWKGTGTPASPPVTSIGTSSVYYGASTTSSGQISGSGKNASVLLLDENTTTVDSFGWDALADLKEESWARYPDGAPGAAAWVQFSQARATPYAPNTAQPGSSPGKKTDGTTNF